jgi:hypothetical protein
MVPSVLTIGRLRRVIERGNEIGREIPLNGWQGLKQVAKPTREGEAPGHYPPVLKIGRDRLPVVVDSQYIAGLTETRGVP